MSVAPPHIVSGLGCPWSHKAHCHATQLATPNSRGILTMHTTNGAWHSLAFQNLSNIKASIQKNAHVHHGVERSEGQQYELLPCVHENGSSFSADAGWPMQDSRQLSRWIHARGSMCGASAGVLHARGAAGSRPPRPLHDGAGYCCEPGRKIQLSYGMPLLSISFKSTCKPHPTGGPRKFSYSPCWHLSQPQHGLAYDVPMPELT